MVPEQSLILEAKLSTDAYIDSKIILYSVRITLILLMSAFFAKISLRKTCPYSEFF